jgi:hypothetical protein
VHYLASKKEVPKSLVRAAADAASPITDGLREHFHAPEHLRGLAVREFLSSQLVGISPWRAG